MFCSLFRYFSNKKRKNTLKELLIEIDNFRKSDTDMPNIVIFDYILSKLILFTNSNIGFISKLDKDKNDKDICICIAVTNIAWNQETLDLFIRHMQGDPMFFNRFGYLNTYSICENKPIIVNDIQEEIETKRPILCPYKHPKLKRFMSLPITDNNNIPIGNIGFANKIEPYKDEDIICLKLATDYLRHFLLDKKLCPPYIEIIKTFEKNKHLGHIIEDKEKEDTD
jgi:hypothetical protein